MSAAASPLPAATGKIPFYQSTLGKKAVMAASGFVLLGFVTGHLAGNLQIYLGPEKLNAYAEFLKHNPPLLWGTRIAVFVSVLLHVISAFQLWALKRRARPTRYEKKSSISSTYASRTMMWSGPIILAFLIYHLLHFTLGAAHPDFREADVYRNVITGFQQIPVSVFYIVAMCLLCVHLYHGIWSMFQSLGIHHPTLTPWVKRVSAVWATLIAVGNISIPLSVLTGLLK